MRAYNICLIPVAHDEVRLCLRVILSKCGDWVEDNEMVRVNAILLVSGVRNDAQEGGTKPPTEGRLSELKPS